MSEEADIRRPQVTMNRDIAIRIVESAKKTIAYNINVMNEKGIIVASSNAARVGSFHEMAYHIISGPDDTVETDNVENLLGTKQGINTVLKYKDVKVGVLGITGAPDEVRPFVNVLKLAVETMIEYELQQQAYLLRSSQQNLLDAGLLYGAAPDADLLKWTMELKLDRSVFRIPLWVHTPEQMDALDKSKYLDYLTGGVYASPQDIITQWKENGFVVFKAFEDIAQACGTYKCVISEYLNLFLAKMQESGRTARVFVGSFCNHFGRYHEAYRRASWVFEHMGGSEAQIDFFYDHVDEWARSFVPVRELHDIFKLFTKTSDERFLELMLKTEHALSTSNFNFERASQKLYVHKNTLFQWTNTFRKHYDIDPVQSYADRMFWKYLCLYVSANRQKG